MKIKRFCNICNENSGYEKGLVEMTEETMSKGSLRRMQEFTMIELLIVISMIAMTLHSKSGFFMANYGKGAF